MAKTANPGRLIALLLVGAVAVAGCRGDAPSLSTPAVVGAPTANKLLSTQTTDTPAAQPTNTPTAQAIKLVVTQDATPTRVKPIDTPSTGSAPQFMPADLDVDIQELGSVAGDPSADVYQLLTRDVSTLAVSEGTAYVAAGSAGVHVIDIQEASSPRHRGWWVSPSKMGSNVLSIAASRGLLLAGTLGGLQIYSLSGKNLGFRYRSFPVRVLANEEVVLLAFGQSLEIYPAGEALPEKPVAQVSLPDEFVSVALDRQLNVAHIVYSNDRAQTVDFSDLHAPRLSPVAPVATGKSLEARTGRVWAVLGSLMRVFSVTPAGTWTLLGEQGRNTYSGGYDTLSDGQGIYATDDLAYVADLRNGLYVIETADPARMYVQGFHTFGEDWLAKDVHVADNLVYVASLDGGLRILETTGRSTSSNVPTPIVASSSASPKSLAGMIAFLSSRDYHDYNPDLQPQLRPHDVYALAPLVPDPMRITAGLKLDNMSEPVVSPDGTQILVGGYDEDGLRLIGLDGAVKESIPPPGTAAWALDWSSRGTLLLVGFEKDNREDLFRFDLGKNEIARLTNDKQRNLFGAWSPDGKRIAYMSDYTLWLMDADGQNKRRIFDGETRDIDWSPDGTQLVFESVGTPGNWSDYDLWVIDAEGATPARRITDTPDMYIFSPSWSPDGTQVAVVGYPGGPTKEGQLFLVDVKSGDLEQLTYEGNNFAPYWVPYACMPSRCEPQAVVYGDPWDLQTSAPVVGCILQQPAGDEALLSDGKPTSLVGFVREQPVIGSLIDLYPVVLAEKWAINIVASIEGGQSWADTAWEIFVDMATSAGAKYIGGQIEFKGKLLSKTEAFQEPVLDRALSELARFMQEHQPALLVELGLAEQGRYSRLPQYVYIGTTEKYDSYHALLDKYPGVPNLVSPPQIMYCGGNGEAASAGSSGATVTEHQVSAMEPVATSTLAVISTATAIPTVTPPSNPTERACSISVAADFVDLYDRNQLGCPKGSSRIVWGAWETFEHGAILWRSDTDDVYAFSQLAKHTWLAISERWNGQSVKSRGDPPSGLQAPVRGFGYVWGVRDDLFAQLGWATDQERGFCFAVQPFERGFVLRSNAVQSCTAEKLYNQAASPDWKPISLAVYEGGWRDGPPDK